MASWRCRKLNLPNFEVEMDSTAVRVATEALGLTSLLLHFGRFKVAWFRNLGGAEDGLDPPLDPRTGLLIAV